MTTVTKTNKLLCILFLILDLICLAGPIIGFTIYGYCTGEVHQKVTLSITMIAAIIMCVVDLLKKTKLRSPFWLACIGLASTMENMLPIFIIMGVCSLLDEFCFSPLYKLYKDKYQAAKTAEAVVQEMSQ